jgi:cytochrome c-type biogenesis protein CcmH
VSTPLAPGRWDRRRRQALSWAACAVVLVGSLGFGVFGDRTPRTDAERVRALAESVACPTCQGQSVASSNSPAAVNIRNEIARLVDAGRSEEEIVARITTQFEGSSLVPESSGVVGLVWVIPVVATVAAAAGLVAVFRRWSAAERPQPSDADRELVAAYLAGEE